MVTKVRIEWGTVWWPEPGVGCLAWCLAPRMVALLPHLMPDAALMPPFPAVQDVPPFCVVAGNPARVIKRLRQGEQGGDQAAGVEAAPPQKKAALQGAGGKPAAEGGR